MDRLAAMHAFVVVAEQRGFAAAAQSLGQSPSAVTRMIAALESHLDTRLFQRTTRSVTLTDAGARYLDRARRILSDVDEAEAAAQAERCEPTGRFVVSAPNVFGRLQVAPLMCAFLANYPRVVGELVLADRMVSLVEGGIDLAVRIGVLGDSSLYSRKIGETRRVLVASPAYLKRRGVPRVVSDLTAHDLVHLTALHPTPDWRLFEGSSAVHLAFTPRFVTNSVDAALGHAELGGGLAMVLAYQVRDRVRAGHLTVVLEDAEPSPLPIQLVYPTLRHLSGKVRAFVDLALRTCDWRFVDL